MIDLDAAVTVLNRFRHRGYAGWASEGGHFAFPADLGADQYEYLEPFEAVAVAEKYLRDQAAPD